MLGRSLLIRRRRMTFNGMRGVGQWALCGLGLLTSAACVSAQERDCGISSGRLTVRIETPDGGGVPDVVVMMPGIQCGGRTGADGTFVLSGLPVDSVMLVPMSVTFCMVPRRVRVDSAGTSVTIRAIPRRSPLDDTVILVHGTPYVPPDYEQFRCEDAVRHFDVAMTGHPAAVADVPPPDEVLAWLLETKDVRELMTRASESGTSLPVAFRYGPVSEPIPEGPVPYHLDSRVLHAGVYMLVLAADGDHLLVQVGRPLARAEQRGTLGSEEGFRVEWRRNQGGWGSAIVVERWSPTGT